MASRPLDPDFQEPDCVDYRTDSLVAQNRNEDAEHSELEHKDTQSRKTDHGDSSEALGKEHPFCVTVSADSASNNYVPRFSEKIRRDQNYVNHGHLNDDLVRRKKTQGKARENGDKNQCESRDNERPLYRGSYD